MKKGLNVNKCTQKMKILLKINAFIQNIILILSALSDLAC